MGFLGTAIGIGTGGKVIPTDVAGLSSVLAMPTGLIVADASMPVTISSALALPTGVVTCTKFDPSDVSGIQNWWNAEAGTTIATGVSQWTSQSGLANVLAQATGANQPPVSNTGAPNSRKCLTFNGSSQFMTVASAGGLTASPWTIGIVLKGTATLGHPFAAGDSAASNGMALLIGANRDLNYPSVATLQDSAYTLGTWEYWLVTNDGATTTFYLSNVSKALTNSTSQPAALTAHTSVGADPTGTNLFTGSIAQIFTYNRVVSAGDRTNLASWVNLLYGL